MTSTTSSRSAKGTPKTAGAADTNGTPPTDPTSELTSGVTEWTLDMVDGNRKRVRVLGENGRVTFGRGVPRLGSGAGGDVRIYRTQSAKGYDAYISGVLNVWSDKVLVDDLGKSPEAERLETAKAEKKAKLEAKRMASVLDAVLAKAEKGRSIEGWTSRLEEEDEEEADP